MKITFLTLGTAHTAINPCVERRKQNFIDGYGAGICSRLYTGQQDQHHLASYKYSVVVVYSRYL